MVGTEGKTLQERKEINNNHKLEKLVFYSGLIPCYIHIAPDTTLTGCRKRLSILPVYFSN